ncbi:MAG: hypothetical protein ACD_79C01135G0002 [uncultured bacterium]|nr:MAG: hypothetical protein ACD_79C01135G0002 [uncultured bacterium]
MKIKDMDITSLAAYICNHLDSKGIKVVLSGGAVVSIYSMNKYQSYDLDFIENISSSRKEIIKAMNEIGFSEQNKYFTHPDTEYFIEFPSGPLAIGREPISEINTIVTPVGNLKIISPTDCVKDRLAGYFYWNDQQSLKQAIMVYKDSNVNLQEVEKWADREEKLTEYKTIDWNK